MLRDTHTERERERERAITKGAGERDVVSGSKEKNSSTEDEDEEESRVLDLPKTTRLTSLGLRIHDPHEITPRPDSIDSREREKGRSKKNSIAFRVSWKVRKEEERYFVI